MSLIKVKWLEYEEIHFIAENFLKQFHPTKESPIPIEEIVDVKFGINIVPYLGLEREIGMVGFLSTDLQTITVDEHIYDYVEVRYRFTLAHEIGHAVLHKDIYKNLFFTSPEEWKDIQKTISDDERVKFEWQANCFAGLILVPREELNTAINNAVADIDKHGISLNDNWDYAWDLIADNVGRAFTVSPGTIHTRLHYDKIKARYEQ